MRIEEDVAPMDAGCNMIEISKSHERSSGVRAFRNARHTGNSSAFSITHDLTSPPIIVAAFSLPFSRISKWQEPLVVGTKLIGNGKREGPFRVNLFSIQIHVLQEGP